MAHGGAQLPHRHGVLLGLHPDRRRAAHAGAAALLQARLFALHAGLPVPALRVRRHRRQSGRRLAGRALRHPAHAGGRARLLQIAGLAACSRRSIRPGPPPPPSPGWWRRKASRASPRTSPRPRRSRRSRRRRPRASGQLFSWVAWFTGSKNAMKGIGFFLGGLLLEVAGLPPRALADGGAARRRSSSPGSLLLPRELGKAKASKIDARTVRQVARRQPAGGGARLPVRRARRLVRRRPAGVPLRHRLALRRGRHLPGGLDDRLWRASRRSAPALVARSADGLSREVPAARLWSLVAGCRSRSRWRCCCRAGRPARPTSSWSSGLALFGLPFAVNSSLHSYLILAYAGSEKAAEDVGFYYAANAAGRLVGTLLSGLLYQGGGIDGLPSRHRRPCCWPAGSITFCCIRRRRAPDAVSDLRRSHSRCRDGRKRNPQHRGEQREERWKASCEVGHSMNLEASSSAVRCHPVSDDQFVSRFVEAAPFRQRKVRKDIISKILEIPFDSPGAVPTFEGMKLDDAAARLEALGNPDPPEDLSRPGAGRCRGHAGRPAADQTRCRRLDALASLQVAGDRGPRHADARRHDARVPCQLRADARAAGLHGRGMLRRGTLRARRGAARRLDDDFVAPGISMILEV